MVLLLRRPERRLRNYAPRFRYVRPHCVRADVTCGQGHYGAASVAGLFVFSRPCGKGHGSTGVCGFDFMAAVMPGCGSAGSGVFGAATTGLTGSLNSAGDGGVFTGVVTTG
jgi:hypothetical protein